MLFFGLAMVFGAVATISTMDPSQTIDQIGISSTTLIGNSGLSPKSALDSRKPVTDP